ncbi:YegP family protein [Lysobacter capsici]|uniref:YegP family protein n=1 Tax=Lysobacter capsici TaxID=435897 RepID=UPI00287B5D83|nr:YegP family protein [Lysobacter capsici]WND81769.1 YegP family protein [Lysobacter capsici]WND86965.1 YegP family protein [Lysobacter capsici]
MSGKYVISKQSNGQYHFVLKAGNDETILSSESYTTHASALNGIHSVQANSPIDARYERKLASNNKPYFVLKAANHQVIGTSELYNSDAARENGITSVKQNGPTTTIEDNSGG